MSREHVREVDSRKITEGKNARKQQSKHTNAYEVEQRERRLHVALLNQVGDEQAALHTQNRGMLDVTPETTERKQQQNHWRTYYTVSNQTTRASTDQ